MCILAMPVVDVTAMCVFRRVSFIEGVVVAVAFEAGDEVALELSETFPAKVEPNPSADTRNPSADARNSSADTTE